MHRLADYIVAMAAMVLVGGAVELLVDHTLGQRDATVGELVDTIATVFTGGYLALGIGADRRVLKGDTGRNRFSHQTSHATGTACRR